MEELLITLPESLQQEELIQLPKSLGASAPLAASSCSMCQYTCQGACLQYCESACEQECRTCMFCEDCQSICQYECQSCQGVACQTCQNCQGVACQTCQCSREGGQGTPPSYSTSTTSTSIKFTYSNGTYSYNYWVVYVVYNGSQIYKEWISTGTRTHTVTGLSPNTTYTVNVGYTNAYGAGDIGKVGSRTVTTDILTTKVYVQLISGGTTLAEGDTHDSIQVGTQKTISWLISNAGLSVPSGYTFYIAEDPYMEYHSLSDDVTVRDNHVLQVFYEEPAPPVDMGTLTTPSPTIVLGNEITLTWRWTGKANTSSWFDIYGNNTLLASIHPNSDVSSGTKSQTYTSSGWSHTGTWTFYIKYRENGDITNSVTVIINESTGGKAYIYDNEQWKLATCYIYDNGWKQCEPNIYDNGWKP